MTDIKFPGEDPISQGVFNYHFHRDNSPILIHSDGFDTDEVLPSYFFRSYNQMPKLEQKALDLAYGKVLDVGACVGCHSNYLQEKGLDVTALERSSLCCQVMKDQGIKQVLQSDFFQLEHNQFDTILLLMNGTGIAGTLNRLGDLLQKLKSLLAPGGQILIDSSDLIFLYMEDDGSAVVDLAAEEYYGELIFQTEYKQHKGLSFPWLYVDPDLLKEYVQNNKLKVKRVFRGDHYDYLAQITH
ncbi:class I SAM-dependent methyltransferase [Sunxiuqinia elliptica]|uniref:Methyltransferase domain-containing protein n=1 Tax=Sunxiuqinia elliptica TaxID=655355 RepID=A0A1I2GU70_9BACT|nr:methyltransferase domain-containing protein [Sunxiuqinia elliptica]SFF20176.1 Methyltransferase domain-containing protein [Sunxiuqinia elliptica]